ncbi:MAG: M23 family peptidase [Cyanobacteria bacterium QS_8_64_29]|nr:MAG: M23 family peptidase [Cyanobacteria bacterium QS_8_64_29]
MREVIRYGLAAWAALAAAASTAPPAAASVWQEASFPIEAFQGYTSPYGYRNAPNGASGGGGRDFHHGLDMAAPQGSYVRNWWAGRVVKVAERPACGTMAIVRSGDWKHIYCHLQGSVEHDHNGAYYRTRGIRLRQGQTVPTGARIARVGTTGNTTGPHLHWGLKYQGQFVNPARVLRKMEAAGAG